MKNIISINTSSFGVYDNQPLDLLEKKGFQIILNPYKRNLKKNETIEICRNVIGMIAGTEILDKEVLENCPDLKVISRCGVGIDNVDIDAAEKSGIKIFNTPDAPTVAVAELTIGLTLELLRKINRMDCAIKKGKWEKMMGNLLHNKNFGLIGFGRIGRKVAEYLKVFGCKISYTDPFVDDGIMGFKQSKLDDLLKWADIISIHASTTEQILGEREFKLMKNGGWLINVSRGKLVDELILFEYLQNGYLSGAASDVFEQEPYSGKLTELNNIILTPHIGSYAKEGRIDMERQSAENLLKGLGYTL